MIWTNVVIYLLFPSSRVSIMKQQKSPCDWGRCVQPEKPNGSKQQRNITVIITLSFLTLSLFFQVLDAEALLVCRHWLMSCQTLRANNGVSWISKWSTLSPSSPAVSQVASGFRGPPWQGAASRPPLLRNTFFHSYDSVVFFPACWQKISIFTS